MEKTRIILLSGGSGTRLWPLSNGVRSKQFLKLLKAPDGSSESMCQRVMRQIAEAKLCDNIIVAASATQKDSIISQMGNGVDIVVEPERRDTFPAIALAATYLLKEKKCSPDEVVVVMPIDPYTEIGYFKTISKMVKAAREDFANIVLLGIVPSEASTKLGYIVPEKKSCAEAVRVSSFKEKPTIEVAQKLIADGALYNGGVFAFKLGYIEKIIGEYTKIDSFEGVRSRYTEFPQNSFDCEILEKEESIGVVSYEGKWEDLGTWNEISKEISERSIGKVVLDDACLNTSIINELDIPILCLGVENAIVAASPDGIFIGNKRESVHLNKYLDKVKNRPMYEERRWGEYKVMDFGSYEDGRKYLVKLLKLKDGCGISYQSHNLREEIWTISNGIGVLMLDDEQKEVKYGDVITIKAGRKHAIKSLCKLEIIEVQMGIELTEEDIERYPFEWK